MKTRTQIMMTSGPTRRGEVVDPGGFASMVEQIQSHYIHVDIEHDPRLPPVGRISGARLLTLDDGRQAVEATMELFEPGDKPDYTPGGKSLISHELPSDHLKIQYDENYRDEESQKIISELSARMAAGKPQYFSKNALDALTILTIAGAFILGAISSGFFNQMGADIYAVFKSYIVRLIRDKGKQHKDNLLAFDFNVAFGQKLILVRVLCSNPSEQDLDDIYDHIIPVLDSLLVPFFEDDQPLSHLVFEKEGSTLKLLYGVRQDGFPLTPATPVVLTKGSPTMPPTIQ